MCLQESPGVCHVTGTTWRDDCVLHTHAACFTTFWSGWSTLNACCLRCVSMITAKPAALYNNSARCSRDVPLRTKSSCLGGNIHYWVGDSQQTAAGYEKLYSRTFHALLPMVCHSPSINHTSPCSVNLDTTTQKRAMRPYRYAKTI